MMIFVESETPVETGDNVPKTTVTAFEASLNFQGLLDFLRLLSSGIE